MKIVGILSLVVLFVLTGCFAQKEETWDTSISQIPVEQTVVTIPELSSSPYIAYAPELLLADKVNILQFHADWCPSCVTLEKNLSESGIPDIINLLKVDYDSATDLRQKYGVTMQHISVVVDENGNELAKFSGVMSADDYLSNLEQNNLLWVNIAQEESMMEKELTLEQEAISESASMMEKEVISEQETMMQKWSYIDYNEDMIGKTESTIIFFAASWCPSCVAANANLAASDIPVWVTILKADFDTEIDLRQKYGVVAQHTFVSVDADGNQLRKWVGGTTIEDIIEKL